MPIFGPDRTKLGWTLLLLQATTMTLLVYSAKIERITKTSQISMNKTEISLCEYYKAIGKRSAYCDKIEKSIVKGIPVSRINAKPGDCPQPIGISGYSDQSSTGCWLDSNCPGVQKCCLEPNPTAHNAQRICRDPVGISSIQGTPMCPADANAILNCLYVHPDACQTDADCMGRQNNVQPSCCMTKCGYRICHLY
ncbi:unnamed protein product [Bursaphelenchus okinawaensis]|uniref:WAP domain-containing protein n=1 Tax=Bursaphelenchus okinawaensis TaxID=465554 RepID=A0A811LCF9_9BILA|nr:unnamed protein product [Bursaphelenchus okinawaensis]CAG9121360.1 unnamed protein product [Bursaphelenchus okinawaensis]